ncbi:helix-turn-helix domain-containing protein [Polaromonas sp.]|uniref:helix-turn-helix domain-containing protein n=1 Tax=Polaromonas sp. TaxID=1869339 RepID=UPI003267F6D7
MNTAARCGDSPVRKWSTDVVKPGQRLDYWVGAICEAFLEMDCSSREDATFDGTLTSVGVDVVSLNQVIASTQDVYRTPGGIARGQQHPYYLITQMRNAWHVRQGGHVAYLRPGDSVLVDSAHAYELHFPDAVGCLSIQMPRSWVGCWLAEPESRAPRVVARDHGWGKSLSALSLQLGEDPSAALAYPPTLLSEQIGATLAAALEPACRNPVSATRDIVWRATQVLRQRLDQSGLVAGVVAQDLGISVRTLHRSFSAQGATFALTLRRCRFEQATRLLEQGRLSHLTIAEIGRRCGYADASHFVREFRRVAGSTPALWRKTRFPS